MTGVGAPASQHRDQCQDTNWIGLCWTILDAAIGMPWRADGREWRHDLPMLEPPLAHTAERCAILRLAIGSQPRRWPMARVEH
jgi:hypothetical protein